METVIKVQNLSKQYRIGSREGYRTFRETLVDAAKAPFLRLQKAGRKALKAKRSSLDSMLHAPSSTRSSHSDDLIWALKDVSFEVKQGEVIGIIGRNGAGKSTLLKILSKITEPTEGRVELKGRVGSLLEVGTGFHPELTGHENIYLYGAILGMDRWEVTRKFDEIVAFAEIEKFVDTPVKRYSSGMYMRLAFAVAAHMEPEILLVDEVLAVGDAEFQKKCLGKMSEVSVAGKTVLFVSHNMFSLENLCTSGILLESGRVAMDDAVITVIGKYLESGKEFNGEVSWASPEVAPGDERARLKAVRVVSEDGTTGVVDIDKEFRIELDYWNLEANGKRLIAIGLDNSMGICLLTSNNLPSASLTHDPWHDRRYPQGLFCTTCTIPGGLLNDGQHSISVFINGASVSDNITAMRNVLPFTVHDTGAMRKEYTGRWIGAIRPRLAWQTTQINGTGGDL